MVVATNVDVIPEKEIRTQKKKKMHVRRRR